MLLLLDALMHSFFGAKCFHCPLNLWEHKTDVIHMRHSLFSLLFCSKIFDISDKFISKIVTLMIFDTIYLIDFGNWRFAFLKNSETFQLRIGIHRIFDRLAVGHVVKYVGRFFLIAAYSVELHTLLHTNRNPYQSTFNVVPGRHSRNHSPKWQCFSLSLSLSISFSLSKQPIDQSIWFISLSQ